jgi:hypothetical protein
MKASDLKGAALDWAVAKCERVEFTYEDHPHHEMFNMHYSTDWAQGGPIIEREGINLEHNPSRCHWIASTPAPEHRNGAVETVGPTPLIAAMRAFVASKLGDEIDIPEEIE